MSKLRLVLALVTLVTGCRAIVPIVGWSNRDAFSSMQATHYSSANDFLYSALLDNLQMIVVFKSPELSYDQLAKYGGTYGNQQSSVLALQHELEAAKSSVWAGSDGKVTSDLLETLSFVCNTKPLVMNGGEPLKEVHKFVLVELPSGEGEKGLQEQDKIIGEVMTSVGKLPGSPSYAAILSSDDTTVREEPKSSRRVLRREAPIVNQQYDVGVAEDRDSSQTSDCAKLTDGDGQTCLLFCIEPMIKYSLDDSITNVLENNYVFNSSSVLTSLEFVSGDCETGRSDCEEYGGTCITLEAMGEYDEASTEFTFVFLNGMCPDDSANSSTTDTVGCGFYTMDLYVNGEKYRRHREELFLFTNVSVPVGASYACGDNVNNIYYSIPSNYSDLNRNEEDFDPINIYQFTNLQVQAFAKQFQVISTSNPEPVFGPAYNCQGYLGTVSLMGIVSILVLVIILYCSVVFMFSINSLDRFDDPRGPTISVENLH